MCVRTSWEDSSCWSWRISSYPILCTSWSSAYTSVRTRAADMTRTGKRSCTRTPASTCCRVPLPVSSLSSAWDHFWRTCSRSTHWQIPRCSCSSAPSSANDRTIFYTPNIYVGYSKRVQKQFYVSVRVSHSEYLGIGISQWRGKRGFMKVNIFLGGVGLFDTLFFTNNKI